VNISVRKYNNKDENDWDEFVKYSENGTIFHLRKFLSYHIDRNFKDHSLIFNKKGKIIAILSGTILKEKKSLIFNSHPGASYGGFIYKKLTFNDCQNIINIFEQYLYNKKIHHIRFVPTPSIYSTLFDETLDYALIWNNYKITENYISSIIPIKNDIQSNLEIIYKLKNRSKNYFEKLIKKGNISFKWNNDFHTFYPILLENKKRHYSKPTHTLEELIKLEKLMPNSLHLLLVYSDNIPIGGTLIFIANKNVGIIFYNMIDYKFYNFQPATLQMIESIKWGKKRKLKYLDFGVSQNPKAKDPTTPSKSLIKFKEESGAFVCIRKTFQKKINNTK
tara:strand:+ start:6215 stop:7216 length:1002 start_codon:yes stop_codon:yes gene_type:complete